MSGNLPKEHVHTEECWEPDSGCDMGRNEKHALAVPREAVIPSTERLDGSTHWQDCWRSHHQCAVAEVERLARELKTEQVLRTTWTKAAVDLADQRDRLRAALEWYARFGDEVRGHDIGRRAREALAGQSRPGETAALLTDAQCESVISELGYREWTGISKGDVRLWDTLIQQAREETAAPRTAECLYGHRIDETGCTSEQCTAHRNSSETLQVTSKEIGK